MPLIHRYEGECDSCGAELSEELRADGTGADDESRVLCRCGAYTEIGKVESVEVAAE